MKKVLKTGLFLGLCVSIFSIFTSDPAQQPKPTVIVMDMDDVMSISQKTGFMDFIGLARICIRHPWVLTALLHINELQSEGIEVSNRVNGSTNVIHTMLESLKERGYGDFSAYEDEILERSLKPKPIQAMVDAVKHLKAQGYIVIGATNHDFKQELAYRKKMHEHGVDLNKLFDAVLVTRVNHIAPAKDSKDAWFYKLNSDTADNLYVAKLESAHKPNEPYFLALKQLVELIAKQKNITIEKIIFTDDTQANTHAAQGAGIEAIHFDLPGGTARKTSYEDLNKTIAAWKHELKKHGVQI